MYSPSRSGGARMNNSSTHAASEWCIELAASHGHGPRTRRSSMDSIELEWLIKRIDQAAATARRNKRECKQLAFDVTVIASWLLILLRQDREFGMLVQELTPGLADTLREAQELVVASCRRRSPWRAALLMIACGETPASKLRAVQSMVDHCVLASPLTLSVLQWHSNCHFREEVLDERSSDTSHANVWLPALASPID